VAISTDFVDKGPAPKASQMSQDKQVGDSGEEVQEIDGSQDPHFQMQNYQGSLKELDNEYKAGTITRDLLRIPNGIFWCLTSVVFG